MKEKLIVFAVIFLGSFVIHYFIFPGDNSMGEMIFVSAIPAAIFALTINHFRMLGVYVINKIFKQKVR